MQVTDTIADMLTRIRNAGRAGFDTCEIPASKLKKNIADILLEEGYVSAVEDKKDSVQGTIVITLKYRDNRHVISGLTRISKPGLRVYAEADDLPQVLGGLGIAIVSTSKGVMTDKKARQLGVGGEVMAYIW